jgi:hypothetical protein
VGATRVTEIDLRIAKVLRFGRTRTTAGVDIYNLINSNAILTYNQTFVGRDMAGADLGADAALLQDQRAD